ncbi:MAG: B-box zinc finger protein [Anaerolineae bacterium]
MSEPLRCVNHPNVETYLRCARCGAPICHRCAVSTEVGYICPACRNRQQQVFYANFRPVYYLVAAAVALPLAFIAGWIIPPSGWLAVILGPLAGMGIAEAVRWTIRRRRGRYTWLVVSACILVGDIPWMLTLLLPTLDAPIAAASLTGLAWPLLWTIVYLVGAIGATIARLRI